jgi:LuxR family maltose regulon positive regulatory protein
MQEAVAMAAPEGYRSQFIDAGPQTLVLLRQARPAAPAFVDDLLVRVSARAALQTGHLPAEDRPDSIAGALTESSIDPLTERELEVLSLLASGLAYREIAQRLIVAMGTVQAHCSNIYGKLGVNNRTHAVLRAREMGLLGEPRINKHA